MPVQTKKSLVIAIYFVLAVSTFLVFWQVRNFDFADIDDGIYVYENPHVSNGLTANNVFWAFTANRSGHWHPVTWLSLMLDCQLFGANAGRIHLVNLFLHIANTLLLFTVLKKMTGSLWPCAFVAAAFALHPMHVESVAWITERKDVLSTFFLLLTIWAYVRYAQKMNTAPLLSRLCNRYYLLAAAFFALGLMAKSMLVTLPFVLLLLDFWPLERIKHFDRLVFYRLVLEKIPFFALSVISSVTAFLVMRGSGIVIDIDNVPFGDRIANVFLSYARYMGKMFRPQNLNIFYPFDAFHIPFWQIAMCALLLLVISAAVIYFGRKQRYLLTGWFWFLGTLVPVIGIVQVDAQAYADRYSYIPYIGLFIMLAWGIPQLLSKLIYRKIVLGTSMVIVLTTLGVCAHRQISYWKNSITLFSHAIEATPNNYIAYNRLGVTYGDLGRGTDAIDAFKQAIKIKADYAMAYYNLGVTYGNLGRGTDAIDAFKQAIKFKPNYAQAHYSLGVACMMIGDKKSAMTELNILKSLNPEFVNDLLKRMNK
jgi:tetratricopeptide (TPR) repeat protein